MTHFPRSLKNWRAARNLSQLDLALEAQVSARHISFLETGRARPSAEMVARLSDALRLPLEARNQLLTQAGFAARYARRDWSDAEMAPIRIAVDALLSNHMPYPALAIDRLWTIERMNLAARNLFGHLGIGEGDSLLDLMMSEALPALVENWPEVAHHAALRLRTESIEQGGVPAFDRVVTSLMAQAGRRDAPTGPVVPTILRLGDVRLSLFVTLAHFGTPEDLSLDDLRIEMYFPMDAETAEVLRAMADGLPHDGSTV